MNKNKNLEEKCEFKRFDIGDIIHKSEYPGDFIERLKKNPVYKCYFCDGYNYNCEEYSPKLK